MISAIVPSAVSLQNIASGSSLGDDIMNSVNSIEEGYMNEVNLASKFAKSGFSPAETLEIQRVAGAEDNKLMLISKCISVAIKDIDSLIHM